MLKIGICGGTFDPIHYGHLIMAEKIREEFKLDKVLFIPTGHPPHKAISQITDARHRLCMVEEAVKSNPYFALSTIEVERDGTTYTIDTLRQLKEIYQDPAELYFMIGADVVFDLLTWKDFTEVFRLCRFIATRRPGFSRQGFAQRVEELERQYGAVIYSTDIPQVDISSTLIRQRVRENRSVKYLVPEGVEAYIQEHGLYSEGNG